MLLETLAVLETIALGTLSTKFIYKKINNTHDVFLKIYDEGLYHFTSKENANKILASKSINPSGLKGSYGIPKIFFFAGLPSFDDYMINLIGKNSNYEQYAIKLNLNYEQIAKFRERRLNDHTIVYNGVCTLDDKQTNIVKVVFDLDKNGELYLKEYGLDVEYIPRPEVLKKLGVNANFYGKIKETARVTKVDIKRTMKNITTAFTSKTYKLYEKKDQHLTDLNHTNDPLIELTYSDDEIIQSKTR